MAVAINQEDWKKVLAELIGVFFFLFIGMGAVVLAGSAGGNSNLALLYVALAHGVPLSIAITALGPVSGAHFNPAVTLAFLLTRRISPVLALLYIAGQIAGGVLAGLALVAVLPDGAWRAANLATPALGTGVGFAQGLLLEIILTFFLAIAIFGTAVDARGNRIGGFGIGLTVFADILVGGPITGAVMNPARAFAPALVSGTWSSDHLIYWIGPILGAAAGALIYIAIFLPRGDEPVVTTKRHTDQPQEPPMSEPGLLKDR